MTELERYLAEEVAEDHVDGIITRREAMRRLALLGVGATAASAMLAAEAKAKAAGGGGDHGHGHHHSNDGRSRSWAPVERTEIRWEAPNGTLIAAWAPAAGKVRGGVLVIHENRGLTEHIKNVAGRFAANGWSALALDLLSEEGGTASFASEAEVTAALSAVAGSTPERFDQDMTAALTELSRRVGRRSPLGAIGFCFGGGMIWRLLASREPRLAAAAPFYGPFPTDGSLKGNKANVLAVYGGLDTRINASIPTAQAALEAARLDYEILTFTQADHAFFNDTNAARFNPQSAEEVWRRVNDWFNDAADDRDRH